MALWLVESAFSAGHLHASLPAITAAEPLAGIALGVLVFGDRVHVTPWLLALQAAGVAAMIGGTVLVARAPTFVKLSLQPAREHGLPKLTVTLGPSADEAGLHVPVSSDPSGSSGQDTPANAVGKDLGGVAVTPTFPGFQDTAIQELGLARLRVAWQKLAKLIVPRLRVSKVPQPPAAR